MVGDQNSKVKQSLHHINILTSKYQEIPPFFLQTFFRPQISYPAFSETLRYSGEDVALVPGESLLCHSPEEPLPPLEADSQ